MKGLLSASILITMATVNNSNINAQDFKKHQHPPHNPRNNRKTKPKK